jgi:hypothetical protein
MEGGDISDQISDIRDQREVGRGGWEGAAKSGEQRSGRQGKKPGTNWELRGNFL